MTGFFNSQPIVAVYKILGKILRRKIPTTIQFNIPCYIAMAFKTLFFLKNSGTPLELPTAEMILKIKMVIYEKNNHNNCRNKSESC